MYFILKHVFTPFTSNEHRVKSKGFFIKKNRLLNKTLNQSWKRTKTNQRQAKTKNLYSLKWFVYQKFILAISNISVTSIFEMNIGSEYLTTYRKKWKKEIIIKLSIYYCKRPEANYKSEKDRVENSKEPKYEKSIYKCLENDFLNAFIYNTVFEIALSTSHFAHTLNERYTAIQYVWKREFPTKSEMFAGHKWISQQKIQRQRTHVSWSRQRAKIQVEQEATNTIIIIYQMRKIIIYCHCDICHDEL